MCTISIVRRQTVNTKIRQNIFPVIAAFIWGTAFVAQSMGADHIDTFTFNAVRFLIASVALFLMLPFLKKLEGGAPAGSKRDLVIGGIICGIAVTGGSALQQYGIAGTTVGKAGFITALYIVIVPILRLFFKKRSSRLVWLSVVIAIFGLYFLCIRDSFVIQRGDFYILLCAFVFALHILAIDYFSARVGGTYLSLAQFMVGAVISSVCMALFEKPSISAIMECIWPLLYVGVLSSGVAYTLQILAQKGSDPTVVSLLLSLESVFSVIGGAVILHQMMTGREYLGCLLMLVAVVIVQLPAREKSSG